MRAENYNWESLFQEHILERGIDYFEDDLVGEVKLENDSISAAVYGAETYAVRISFSGEKVADMHCTCPYAEDGRRCKHMAAVLYYREAQRSEGSEPETLPAEDNSIAQMISEVEESVVRLFLADILQEDAQLCGRFKIMTGQEKPSVSLSRYQQRLHKIVERHSGRDRFITWDHASDFERDVEQILWNDVSMMIRYGNHELACAVIDCIFLMLPTLEIDDDGQIGMLADSCVEAWKNLLEQAGPEVEEAQFQWVLETLEEDSLDYLEEYLIQLLMESFRSPAQIREKLAFVEEKLQEIESGDSKHFSYNTGFWIKNYIRLLEESGAAPETIEAWCRDRRQYPPARDYLVRLYKERQDYQQVLQLLQEGCQSDSGHRGEADTCRMQMLQIYRETGDTEAYRALLWEMLTKHKPGDLDLFRELKALYPPEEWEPVREKLFSELQSSAPMGDLYTEEELYDRLLPWVLNTNAISMLDKYAPQLAQIYPEEILDGYEACLNRLVLHAANRTRYRDWVSILRRMRKLQGGEARVQKIAADWKIRFYNRPAMMDELRKL